MAASSRLPLSWARADRTRNSMFEGTTREDRDSAGADPASAATRIQDSSPIPLHEVREGLWSSFTPSPPDRDKEMEGGPIGLPPLSRRRADYTNSRAPAASARPPRGTSPLPAPCVPAASAVPGARALRAPPGPRRGAFRPLAGPDPYRALRLRAR